MGRRVVAGLFVVLTAVGTAAPAHAKGGTRTFFNEVIARDFAPPNGTWDEIYGDLVSKKEKCVVDRIVTAKHAADGGAYTEFGTDTTDALGNFSITGSAPESDFFVVAVKKKGNCRGTKVSGVFSEPV